MRRHQSRFPERSPPQARENGSERKGVRSVFSDQVGAKEQRRATEKRTRLRRGLSTLELVLVAPILLMIMALIVNFGTAACWKARCDGIARNYVWSDRDPRRADWMPVPEYWRVAQASQSMRREADLTALDDARLRLPAVRGPLPFGTIVNGDLLNPATGFNAGRATLTRRFPMLGKLPEYRFDVENALMDKGWEYWRMGMHADVPRHEPFRVPLLYQMSQPPTGNVAAYQQAAMAILNAPFARALDPLDNDPDWRRYMGYAPNFHPRLPYGCFFDRCSPCTTDLQYIEDLVKDNLTIRRRGGRIPLVPKTMTRRFLSMYRQALQLLQNQLNSVPPPSGAAAAALQAEMAQVQQYISQLQQFDATLP